MSNTAVGVAGGGCSSQTNLGRVSLGGKDS